RWARVERGAAGNVDLLLHADRVLVRAIEAPVTRDRTERREGCGPRIHHAHQARDENTRGDSRVLPDRHLSPIDETQRPGLGGSVYHKCFTPGQCDMRYDVLHSQPAVNDRTTPSPHGGVLYERPPQTSELVYPTKTKRAPC